MKRSEEVSEGSKDVLILIADVRYRLPSTELLYTSHGLREK